MSLNQQHEVPVFFDSRMVCTDKLPSPSAAKPAQVVADWKRAHLKVKESFVSLAARKDFELVHDADHITAIYGLRKKNGFQTLSQAVNGTLAWTSGSFLTAARWAVQHQGIACSPSSGFHHAGFDVAHGFCTFNGLMVAAAVLRRDGFEKPIGIFDADYHFGDGTTDILKRGLVSDVIHVTAETGYPLEANAFFEKLPSILEGFKSCGLLMYQAGADCHIDDPYGGFLSSEQMRLRDKMVFEFCVKEGIPCVWNLAGGYQESIVRGKKTIQKVLDLHAQTMIECLTALGIEVPLKEVPEEE